MSERELTPEQEAEISRLLADAASPSPMPAEVAVRLDDVLADLVAGRTEESNVVPLRARRWPKVLVAAAAVGLFGYLGTGLVQQSADDQATYAERGVSADAGGEAPELAPPAASAPEPRDGDSSELGPAEGPEPGPVTVPKSEQQVADDALRLAASLYDTVETSGAALEWDRAHLDYASKGCGALPALTRQGADGVYQLRLAKQTRGLMVLYAVNRNAARVDIYSCRSPLLPISSTFLLAAR